MPLLSLVALTQVFLRSIPILPDDLTGIEGIEQLFPQESGPSPPVVIDKSDYFSACLLLNDDNHYLIEWLAYHYQVMPLRNLIVAVVPLSRTSPKQVLDRWRDRIHITEWNDTDIFSEVPAVNDASVGTHRSRQTRFNARCLQRLHTQEEHWVIMTDVDEYTLINPRTHIPGDVLYKPNNRTVPYMDEPGVILNFLKETPVPHSQHPIMNSPCIPVPRRQFGVLESSHNETHDQVDVNSSFNASAFQTLRWRKYGESKWLRKFTLRKTMIDLSRVNASHIPEESDPHRPIKSVCPDRDDKSDIDTSLFVAHHYLGTWDQFTYRTDARLSDKNHKNWRMKEYGQRKAGNLVSDHVRPWLAGFVRSVGQEEAARLLHRVGELDPIP